MATAVRFSTSCQTLLPFVSSSRSTELTSRSLRSSPTRISDTVFEPSFELPIAGVVHHLFERESVIPFDGVEEQFRGQLEVLRSEMNHSHLLVPDALWDQAVERCIDLFKHSYTWYSGHPSLALFITSSAVAYGGCIESSAYNPTVNPLQVSPFGVFDRRWHSSTASCATFRTMICRHWC